MSTQGEKMKEFEIYIEQISTVRAIHFEREDSDKYSVPAGYYARNRAQLKTIEKSC